MDVFENFRRVGAEAMEGFAGWESATWTLA